MALAPSPSPHCCCFSLDHRHLSPVPLQETPHLSSYRGSPPSPIYPPHCSQGGFSEGSGLTFVATCLNSCLAHLMDVISLNPPATYRHRHHL